MSVQLDDNYWEQRYQNQSTGWDIGYVSTPLKSYFDQLKNNHLKILIPGAGNAYEAGYLWELGFQHVFVLDFAQSPLDSFRSRFPTFPESNLMREDFFEHVGKYDLIIEQTFFCAIDPDLRASYVNKTHELLSEDGRLVGLLWNRPMNIDGPPYGGSAGEYRQLFGPKYELKVLELAYNSIPPRQGNELFINFLKVN